MTISNSRFAAYSKPTRATDPHPDGEEKAALFRRIPSGIVCFLFTDIEGSTKLWEAHPELMKAAMAHHDMLLRAAIEVHGGYVFKTVGDAFCATFQSPLDALFAALASLRALRDARWADTGPLRVRMALHTGTAEEREGDYFGPTVNRAARLLSTGHGGQLLVSLVTHELLKDHIAGDITMRDLGEHRLKDLVRPERIFEVRVPDLVAAFPAIRSSAPVSARMPHKPIPMLGGSGKSR